MHCLVLKIFIMLIITLLFPDVDNYESRAESWTQQDPQPSRDGEQHEYNCLSVHFKKIFFASNKQKPNFLE